MGDVSFVASEEEEEEAHTPGGARRLEDWRQNLLLPRDVPTGSRSSVRWDE